MKKIVFFLVIAAMAGVFCFFSKDLPDVGAPDSPPNTHVSAYYIEHGKEDTASPNIVSATLADYRGFDTMWETTVMFISGLGTTLILIWDLKRKEKK